MAPLTHVLFDFFGTPVGCCESRVAQGFQGSYGVLQEAGAERDYAAFLERWEAMFQVFESRAQSDLPEPARRYEMPENDRLVHILEVPARLGPAMAG